MKHIATPDHPDIARALVTGYPRKYKSVKCTDCEKELFPDEKVYIIDGEPICGSCMIERILESFDADDLANAFGIQSATVFDYLTEQEEPC